MTVAVQVEGGEDERVVHLHFHILVACGVDQEINPEIVFRGRPLHGCTGEWRSGLNRGYGHDPT